MNDGPNTSTHGLGCLNLDEFYCKGCGLLPKSDDCPHCKNLSKAKHGWPSVTEVLQTSEAIVVGIIAVLLLSLFYNGVLK